MPLQIPMPGDPGTGFLQGLDTGSTLIRRLVQNKIAQAQEARAQSMAPYDIGLKQAQINDYGSVAARRLAQTSLEKSQEARQQSILPHLLQQYQDAHQKASQELPYIIQKHELENNKALSNNEIEKLYNDRIKEHLMSPQAAQPNQVAQPQQPQENPIAPLEAVNQPQQNAAQPEAPLDEAKPKLAMTAINGIPAEVQQGIDSLKPNYSSAAPGNGATAPTPDKVIPNPIQQQVGNFINTGNPQGVQPGQPAQPEQAAGSSNGETILTPANPQNAWMDEIAGLPKSPIPAPTVRIGKDGLITKVYPSGKITRLAGVDANGNPTGAKETPEAKREGDTQKALDIAQGKADIKTAGAIKDNARSLLRTISNLKVLGDLSEANPGLTGPSQGVARKLHMSKNPNLSKFEETAGLVQGDLAKLIGGNRTGIGTINWAKSVKPTIWNPDADNFGMINGGVENGARDFAQANEEYKSLTGKDLPFKLPEIKTYGGNNMTTIIDPEGGEHKILSVNLAAALKKHPGTRVKKEKS
jgi:hypothetical protein